jgi:predicted membrane protein
MATNLLVLVFYIVAPLTLTLFIHLMHMAWIKDNPELHRMAIEEHNKRVEVVQNDMREAWEDLRDTAIVCLYEDIEPVLRVLDWIIDQTNGNGVHHA